MFDIDYGACHCGGIVVPELSAPLKKGQVLEGQLDSSECQDVGEFGFF